MNFQPFCSTHFLKNAKSQFGKSYFGPAKQLIIDLPLYVCCLLFLKISIMKSIIFPDSFAPSPLDSEAESRKDKEAESVESEADPKQSSVVGDDESLEPKHEDITHLSLFGSKQK